jgi:hypothetical protein
MRRRLCCAVQDLNGQPLLLEQLDASYDAVLCVNGLQYLTQPEAVLTEVILRFQVQRQLLATVTMTHAAPPCALLHAASLPPSMQPGHASRQPQQRIALLLGCLVCVTCCDGQAEQRLASANVLGL